ncbi:MAG: preprotein translocase subunit SecG [Candidatus Paceibacterota bacterium]|jgi:preprotein translocase subunit SecG
MLLLSSYLPWIQIVLSALLVGAILLQQNEAGLGNAFGGGQANTPSHTKRGLEKHLFNITIIIAILFVASTFLALFV